MINETRQAVLRSQVMSSLRMTQGTMQITMVVADQEELEFCEEFKNRKKHTKMLDFEIQDRQTSGRFKTSLIGM